MLRELYDIWVIIKELDLSDETFEDAKKRKRLKEDIEKLKDHCNQIMKCMDITRLFEKGKIDYYTFV